MKKIIKVFLAILLLIIGIAGIVLDIIYGKQLNKGVSYLISITSAIILLFAILFVYSILKNKSKKVSLRQMSLIGIQSAITVILYYFVKINVPFFPPWLDLQVSEIPALITGFAYGPFAGCLVMLVRFVLKIPATMTAGVGEAADLILGLSLVLISSIIYKKNKTIKGAIVGLSFGIIVSTILACVLNWVALIPAYLFIAGFEKAQLIDLLSYMPFEITENNFMFSYIFIGVLPFNLFRYVLVFIFTFLLYKKTHKLLDRITKEKR